MKTQAEIVIKAKAYAESIGNEDGTSAYDYVMGYNQCQEDMADKKYTEEDINKAINLARKTKVNIFGANGEESIGFVHSNNEVLKIVVNKQD